MGILKFLKQINKLGKAIKLLYNFIVKLLLSSAVIAKAWGHLAGYVLSFVHGKIVYIRRIWKEKKASLEQIEQRELFVMVDREYKKLTEDQKKAWRKFAPKGQNEYSYFMSVNLKRVRQGLDLLYWPEQIKGGWNG
jgi:hypothetical protein